MKADLRAKEVEGQKRYYELRIESLNQSIHSQEARIQSLSQQLEGYTQTGARFGCESH